MKGHTWVKWISTGTNCWTKDVMTPGWAAEHLTVRFASRCVRSRNSGSVMDWWIYDNIIMIIYIHTRIALISGINQAINAQICTDMHRYAQIRWCPYASIWSNRLWSCRELPDRWSRSSAWPGVLALLQTFCMGSRSLEAHCPSIFGFTRPQGMQGITGYPNNFWA